MVGIVTARGDEDLCSHELFVAAQRHGGGAYIDPIGLRVEIDGEARLLADGRPIQDFDAVVLRGLNRAGDIDVQFESFELMQALGIPVLNSPAALSVAESKSATLFRLQRLGIPVPRTVACQTEARALEAVRELGTAVIKPMFGALGIGVERVDAADSADRIHERLDEWRSICIQELIPTGGRDIRAFVVGGRLIGAVVRIAQGGEWRTNVHQGGRCEPYPLSARERDMCLRAAAAIGLEYTGIDILPGPDGPVLLEVNGAPQWHGLAEATGIDVADAVVSRAVDLAAARPAPDPSLRSG